MESLLRRRLMGARPAPAPAYAGFTLQAGTGGGRFNIHRTGNTMSTWNPSFQYSFDGVTWQNLPFDSNITVSDKVYIKGDNPNGVGNYDSRYVTFAFTNIATVSGDIRSLYDSTMTASTIPAYCFFRLFYNIATATDYTGLILPPFVSNYCYYFMFLQNTGITAAPVLPATTLADSCYYGMFSACSALTQAPALPATNLSRQCYRQMFQNCSSLAQAPALPATTLQSYCYAFMFQNCTSLISAPDLPALTLVSQCYNQMFNGCINLNSIKAMFTHAPSSDYTTNWVSNVAAAGTFYKNAAATWISFFGNYAIPTGWTVQTVNA